MIDIAYGGFRKRTLHHILVVDDERHIVRLLQVNLERAGYRVSMAFSGREALEQVQKERPDLIILDAEMPERDGFAVLQELRERPETRAIPVLMLLQNVSKAEEFAEALTGADGYLTKPFNPVELLRMVRFLGR